MTRPHLADDVNPLQGLAAVALFAVLAAVFLTAEFGTPAGFGEGSITASIGYAMFDLVDLAEHNSEGFLVAFVVIAFALDAALEGAVMLARREGEGGPLESADDDAEAAARADGGHEGVDG